MEMKPGFRQTEIGFIPEDWELSTLGTICETSSGTTPSRSMFEHYYKNGKIPWVKTLDLNNSYIYITDENVTKTALKETALRQFPVGTVLIAMYGGFNQIGRTGLLQINAAVNQAITAILPQTGCLVPEFLLFILNYRVGYWKTVASSSRKDPNITSKDVRNFPLAYPSIAEQKAIAAALSDADALIESLEYLIAKKRQIKQGVMQELLTGKKRLSGFTGEWQNKRLDQIGEISGGGVDKKIHSNEVPVRLVNYLDVYQKDFLYSKDLNHHVTAPFHQYKKCLVKKGDIFLTPSSEVPNDIGISAVAMEDINDAVYSYHVVRLRLAETWDLTYRAYAFKSRHFLAQAEQLCEGSGIRYVLTQNRFRQLTVLVPSKIEEQRAIGKVLFNMDTEIAALEEKLNKAWFIKQGMMQELLTGRIRLI